MTFVEKQMACHLLGRREWTWPEIFAFIELVTQKPLEQDERRKLQDQPPPETVKIFHAEQPIRLLAISNTVFDKVSAEEIGKDFFHTDNEYREARAHFAKFFEEWAEKWTRENGAADWDATVLRDRLHLIARDALKTWWDTAGVRIKGIQPWNR